MPAHAAGTVDVVVTTPGGMGTGTNLYTYRPLPTVSIVNPNSGLTGGDETVEIKGSGFTGTTAISFGGTPVTVFRVDSDASIRAQTPVHAAGAVDVGVTTSGGTGTGAGIFTYRVPTPAVGNPTSSDVTKTTATLGGTVDSRTAARRSPSAAWRIPPARVSFSPIPAW